MNRTFSRPIYWHLACRDFKAEMQGFFAKTARGISAPLNHQQIALCLPHKAVLPLNLADTQQGIKVTIVEAHKQVTALASSLDSILTKAFSSAYTKSALQVSVMLLIWGGLAVLTTYAQSPIGGGDDLVGTLKSIGAGIYDELRGPICGLGLVLAAVKFFSSDTNSRKQAGFIVAGVIVFALVPSLLEYIGKITKSGSLSFK